MITMATRLQEAYQGKIRPSLKKEFGYTSDMQVPRLEKIVVNMGVGDTVNDIKKMEIQLAKSLREAVSAP